MALELSDVKRIANLARIEVSDGEAAQTLTQLNQFFTLVEQMQAVDTTGIEPMAHPIELIQAPAQRLRDDAVTEADRRAEVLGGDFRLHAPPLFLGVLIFIQ